MTNGSLMKVESIAECDCSPWCILQYFWPTLSDNWSWKPIFDLFESGHFRQVLLYMINTTPISQDHAETDYDGWLLSYSNSRRELILFVFVQFDFLVPINNFQLCQDRSSWVETVFSPNQQFVSFVRTGLPWLKQYQAKINVSC